MGTSQHTSVLCCSSHPVVRTAPLSGNAVAGMASHFEPAGTDRAALVLTLRAVLLCSAGCFDQESEAARAYDKMMLWCEIHNAGTIKGGITNFDLSEYEKDIGWLTSVSQVCDEAECLFCLFVAWRTTSAMS